MEKILHYGKGTESRENREKRWMGKKKGERETINPEEKKTREISKFTNDDALQV